MDDELETPSNPKDPVPKPLSSTLKRRKTLKIISPRNYILYFLVLHDNFMRSIF